MSNLNIQGALQEYGVLSGMSSHQLGTLFAQCAEEQKNLQEALNAGVLPFWSLDNRSTEIETWKDKLNAYDKMIVVASPMIVQSIQHIETTYNVRYITSVTSEVSDWKDTLLVVLASDVWMNVWLSHHLDTTKISKGSIVYCIEDETSIPKDVAIASAIEPSIETGVLDERFVCFTNFAMALQADWRAALDGIKRGVERISTSTVWDNTSALLAVLACGLDFQPHVETVFVADVDCWQEVQSLSILTGRMESRMSSELISQSRLVLSQTVQIGEEGIFNMLSANPKQLVILLRPEQQSDESPLIRSLQVQYNVLQQWLFNEQVPHVIWDIPNNWTTTTRMAFRIQWIHRSMLTVAMQGDDPTLYDAADRWRETSTNLWNRLGSSLT